MQKRIQKLNLMFSTSISKPWRTTIVILILVYLVKNCIQSKEDTSRLEKCSASFQSLNQSRNWRRFFKNKLISWRRILAAIIPTPPSKFTCPPSLVSFLKVWFILISIWFRYAWVPCFTASTTPPSPSEQSLIPVELYQWFTALLLCSLFCHFSIWFQFFPSIPVEFSYVSDLQCFPIAISK